MNPESQPNSSIPPQQPAQPVDSFSADTASVPSPAFDDSHTASTSQLPQPKQRSRWVMWLIVWLVSLPLAAVIQFVMRFALQDTETNATDGIKMVVNMVSLLMGMYGLLGWIPLVVSLARNKR